MSLARLSKRDVLSQGLQKIIPMRLLAKVFPTMLEMTEADERIERMISTCGSSRSGRGRSGP